MLGDVAQAMRIMRTEFGGRKLQKVMEAVPG